MGGSWSACTDKGSSCRETNSRPSPNPGKNNTSKKRQSKKLDQEPQVHIWSTPGRLEKEKQYYGTVLRHNAARDQTAMHDRLDRNISHVFGDGGNLAETAEFTAVKTEIKHYLTWLNQCGNMFRHEHSLNLDKREVPLILEGLKKLAADLMLQQDDLITISNKAKDLATGHPCTEQVYIEETLSVAWKQHTELLNAVSNRCHALEKLTHEHRHFDKRLQKLKQRFKRELNAADSIDSIGLSACEVDQQLDKCKSIHKNTPNKESEHTTTQVYIGKLDPVYESFDTMVQIEGVKQTDATTESNDGVETEGPSQKMKDFEKEVNELLKWVEHTRTRMTMRDTTTDLREQLAVQQVFVVNVQLL